MDMDSTLPTPWTWTVFGKDQGRGEMGKGGKRDSCNNVNIFKNLIQKILEDKKKQ